MRFSLLCIAMYGVIKVYVVQACMCLTFIIRINKLHTYTCKFVALLYVGVVLIVYCCGLGYNSIYKYRQYVLSCRVSNVSKTLTNVCPYLIYTYDADLAKYLSVSGSDL